jgi:hypothetical protein
MTTARARRNLPERTSELTYERTAVDACTAGGSADCELLLSYGPGDFALIYHFQYARIDDGRYLVTDIWSEGDAG